MTKWSKLGEVHEPKKYFIKCTYLFFNRQDLRCVIRMPLYGRVRVSLYNGLCKMLNLNSEYISQSKVKLMTRTGLTIPNTLSLAFHKCFLIFLKSYDKIIY